MPLNPLQNGPYYNYDPFDLGEPLAFTPLGAQILIFAGILTRITRRLTTKYPHIPPYTARVLFALTWIAWILYGLDGGIRVAVLIFAIILGATACIPWTKIPPLSHLKHPNPQEWKPEIKSALFSFAIIIIPILAIFLYFNTPPIFVPTSNSHIYEAVYKYLFGFYYSALLGFVFHYPFIIPLWVILVFYSARLRWRTGLYAVGASLIGCGILWAASFEYHDQGITFQKFPYLDSYLTFIATVLSAFLVGKTNWKKLVPTKRTKQH
ncbi:hypothetical protein GP475_02365 [Corynebacterium poyangense]|uniref:Uncharacterized protein n=1 Tax=Corynebacterium poyangense TaxID=2684405 RepID=A0A7H0SM32_9CORY|nr:hypothetical protein [Corynebacterium poyangense]QNQ89607.1 hypothetical protein GP475_02365 [Corynebacterium poyangense]